MEPSPDLFIEITNSTGQNVTLSVDGGITTLPASDPSGNPSIVYHLHQSEVKITRNESDEIQIDLSGVEKDTPNNLDGMCLCLSKGYSIALTLSQSMNITIGKGMKSAPEGEGVGCGETGD